MNDKAIRQELEETLKGYITEEGPESVDITYSVDVKQYAVEFRLRVKAKTDHGSMSTLVDKMSDTFPDKVTIRLPNSEDVKHRKIGSYPLTYGTITGQVALQIKGSQNRFYDNRKSVVDLRLVSKQTTVASGEVHELKTIVDAMNTYIQSV